MLYGYQISSVSLQECLFLFHLELMFCKKKKKKKKQNKTKKIKINKIEIEEKNNNNGSTILMIQHSSDHAKNKEKHCCQRSVIKTKTMLN